MSIAQRELQEVEQAVVDAPTTEYDKVLGIVSQWPLSLRVDLMQTLIRELAREVEAVSPKRSTLAEATGLFKTDQPPPTDEEVDQWIDERRMEKYG